MCADTRASAYHEPNDELNHAVNRNQRGERHCKAGPNAMKISDSSVNSACIDRNFKFENVYAEGPPGLGTLPQKLLDVSDNVTLGSIKSFNEVGTPGASGYAAYRRLPNGGLHIWGLTTAAGATNTAVTFPAAFTAVPTIVCSSTAGGTTSPVNAVSAATSGFSINNPGTTVVVAWSATGHI